MHERVAGRSPVAQVARMNCASSMPSAACERRMPGRHEPMSSSSSGSGPASGATTVIGMRARVARASAAAAAQAAKPPPTMRMLSRDCAIA